MEVLGWDVPGEEIFPNEEHEFQEGKELDYLPVASALGVFTGPEVEVEVQLDQVGNVVGLGFGGIGSYGHNGVNDSQGDRFFPLDWGILDTISFELPDEVLVKTSVRL